MRLLTRDEARRIAIIAKLPALRGLARKADKCRARLCGSPPRHKRASSLRKRNGPGRDRQPRTQARERKPCSILLMPQGQAALGSLPLRHLHRLQVDQRAELGPLLLDRDQ